MQQQTASVAYHGSSLCRICGCQNGSHEFEDGQERTAWPSGLLHYVELHNVHPQDWFVEYVHARASSFETEGR